MTVRPTLFGLDSKPAPASATSLNVRCLVRAVRTRRPHAAEATSAGTRADAASDEFGRDRRNRTLGLCRAFVVDSEHILSIQSGGELCFRQGPVARTYISSQHTKSSVSSLPPRTSEIEMLAMNPEDSTCRKYLPRVLLGTRLEMLPRVL